MFKGSPKENTRPSFNHPFGPYLMMDYVEPTLVDALKQAVRKAEATEGALDARELSGSRSGNVSRLFRFPVELCDQMEYVEKQLRKYLHTYHLHAAEDTDREQKIHTTSKEDVILTSMFVAFQRAGDWHESHKHCCNISGVIYLDIPKELENEMDAEGQYPSAGLVEFLYGDYHEYSKSRLKVRPKEGLVLLFPGWMKHMVYPFRADVERRVFSFNGKAGNGAPCMCGRFHETSTPAPK